MAGRHAAEMKRALACAFVLAATAGPAAAFQLLGASFTDGVLYDVDSTTGAATNPRPINVPWCGEACELIAVTYVAGIETEPERPYGFALVTTVSNEEFPSTLMRAARSHPVVSEDAIDALDVQIGEGDLALDPVSGDLFAMGLTNLIAPFTLVRIDAQSGASVVGEIGFSDVSGLAFDAAGTLYALDTGADALLVLDPDDASTLSSVALSRPLGAVAGMDFDAEGTLWVADGGTGGANALFTLDPATGALDEVGPLGLASGLSALAAPEPEASLLAATALLAVALRRLS